MYRRRALYIVQWGSREATRPRSRSQQRARDLRPVVIAPLAYRPRPGSRLLYRQPAYLIVIDAGLELEQIVRSIYLERVE